MAAKGNGGGRWIKPAIGNYAPTVILAVIPEERHSGIAVMPGAEPLTLHALHVGYCRAYRGRWRGPDYFRFSDVEEFWTWLESDLPLTRRIHVYTPNALHTLALAGWYQRLDDYGALLRPGRDNAPPGRGPAESEAARMRRRTARGAADASAKPGTYFLRSFVDGMRTAVIRYQVHGRRFTWSNFGQYVTASEDDIARSMGHANRGSILAAAGLDPDGRTPAERSMLWARFMSRVAKWWTEHHGGPWGASAAGCAANYLRSRIMPKSILHHDDERAGALEAAAIHGGRRSVWYVGNIGTEDDWRRDGKDPPPRSEWPTIPAGLFHHDIRSMYPFLLAHRDYPVQLLDVRHRCSVPQLAKILTSYGAIASVTLAARRPIYPQRTPAGVRYPTGHFTTTLAGPELMEAITGGELAAVHTVATYRMARPFELIAKGLLALREYYRAEDDPAWEAWMKSLANSMSGKLAQRTSQRVPRPDVAPRQRWGPWTATDTKTGKRRHFQALAGMVFERVDAPDSIRPMGAAYAYLTSYGRILMNGIRDRCPPRSVLAMDTDGLWTTPAALPTLYPDGTTDRKASGSLRITQRATVGRFFGAQHYWCGHYWVLSGQPNVILQGADGSALVTERSFDLWGSLTTPTAAVIEKRSVRNVCRVEERGVIGEDGWIEPQYIPMGGTPSTRQRLPDATAWKERS